MEASPSVAETPELERRSHLPQAAARRPIADALSAANASFEEVDRIHAGRSLRPYLSVIVPVYDNAEGLAKLLRRLERQTYPHDRFECIVIDNGSDPPVTELPETSFQLSLHREPRPGSYAARNRGVEASVGNVVAFTDSDCLPAPDWLECGVRGLARYASPAMLAGRIALVPRGERAAGAVETHSLAVAFPQRDYVERNRFGATANLFAHRSLFDLVGSFDESLFSGGDYDWGQRVHAAGYPQGYDGTAVVEHPALTSLQQLVRKHRRVAGGIYLLRTRLGWGIVRICLRGYFMGWLRIRSHLRPRGKLPGELARIAAVEFVLRNVQMLECVRLHFGGRPRRV